MTKRIVYDQPFNRLIPPLFQRGGLLYKPRGLGVKIGFMVEMPDNHFTGRDWLNLYESARRELMDVCFLEHRTASFAELSQLDWVKQAGHRLWLKDDKYPRCDLNIYIEELERLLVHHFNCVDCDCTCDAAMYSLINGKVELKK